MKHIILIVVLLSLVFSCYAQGGKSGKNIDDLLFGEESKKEQPKDGEDQIVTVLYGKKDARRAMLYSMLLPGSGQYYANPGAITAYIFPVIELALIGGIVYYYRQGDKQTDAYEKYATGETIQMTIGGYDYVGKRYDRNFQLAVQNYVINRNANDIYDGDFFRLDNSNTQHFYEDIGKYNKYIFGWADWYHTFAANANGSFVLDTPELEGAMIFSGGQAHEIRWLGNYTVADFISGSPAMQPIDANSPLASPMRRKYIRMRRDAEAEYGVASNLSFVLALNHIVSGLDAIRVTNRRNRYFLSDSGFKFNYYAGMRENKITPTLVLGYNF